MWLEFPISGLWADSQQILAKYRLPTSRSTSPEKQSAEIPISAHPNPFSQELTLRFEQSDEQGQGQVEVYDAAGRVLLQKSVALASGRNDIPLCLEAAAPAGVYYVSLQSGEHRYTLRVVKE